MYTEFNILERRLKAKQSVVKRPREAPLGEKEAADHEQDERAKKAKTRLPALQAQETVVRPLLPALQGQETVDFNVPPEFATSTAERDKLLAAGRPLTRILNEGHEVVSSTEVPRADPNARRSPRVLGQPGYRGK